MTENNNTGRAPDFKGDGVAVWVNEKPSDGQKYLSIAVLGNIRLAAFKYEQKKEEVKPTSANEIDMSKL